MQGFLNATDELARAYVKYKAAPSETAERQLWHAGDDVIRFLDMSKNPPAERREIGGDAVILLSEVLSRIDLPSAEMIPDVAAFADPKKPARWVIPKTEITIGHVDQGPFAGEFLFTPDTVARAQDFYDRTQNLPYRRDMIVANPRRIQLDMGGWMIPLRSIEAAPHWLRAVVFDQVVWKWLALALLLLLAFGIVALFHRWVGWTGQSQSVGACLRRLLVPASVLLLMRFINYLTEFQISVTGLGAEFAQVLIPTVTYLAFAWTAWLGFLTIGEGIIASPRNRTKVSMPICFAWLLGSRVSSPLLSSSFTVAAGLAYRCTVSSPGSVLVGSLWL